MARGYRQMIRDRMPENWVFVLKYLHKLGSWIDLVYRTRIGWYNDHWNKHEINELKSKAVKELLSGSFFDTLDDQRISNEEYTEWLQVSYWVRWFNTNYLYIKDYYLKNAEILSHVGLVKELRIYTRSDKLTEAIIQYIENGEKA